MQTKEGDPKAAEAKPADAKAGDAKGGETQGKPAVFEKKTKKLKLFNSKDKLVLPMYCKSKLDAKEIYGLATHAADYVSGWREASGNAEAKAEDLAPLDPAAFAKFYAKVTADMMMDVGMLGSQEAEEKAPDLAATINFQNANLKKVGWFQFWIFLCSGEVQPATHEYMRNTPVDEEQFLKAMQKKKGDPAKPTKRLSRRKFKRMKGRSKPHFHPRLK